MTDKEKAQHTLDLLCMWSRNIAMLPVEEVRESIEHAEIVGPYMDPTAFIRHMHDPKQPNHQRTFRRGHSPQGCGGEGTADDSANDGKGDR